MKLFFLAILLLAPFDLTCSAQGGLWNVKYGSEYLEKLKKCEKPAPYVECNEVTVINVVILYEKSDRRVLSNLMDAAQSSEVSNLTLTYH